LSEVNPLEALVVALGRHVNIRGSERALRAIYPCATSAKRFVKGTRARGDGLLMELDSRSWIDWNLLFRGDYEPHLTRLWNRLASKKSVAIDVGANIGAHTLTMARSVGPGGRVLAFEPNPIVRRVLERNLDLNGIKHVRVFDCALGSQAGSLPLRVPKQDSEEFSNLGLASLVALETPHDLITVEVKTLDDVLKAERINRVDVIKIDVQGYELETLRGMRDCIARHRPALVFEYDAWAWHQANVEPADAFNMLEAAGYGIFRLDDSTGTGERPLDRGEALPDYLDLLALPSPRLPVSGPTSPS
jgi:FkbM family methyltransferase